MTGGRGKKRGVVLLYSAIRERDRGSDLQPVDEVFELLVNAFTEKLASCDDLHKLLSREAIKQC